MVREGCGFWFFLVANSGLGQKIIPSGFFLCKLRAALSAAASRLDSWRQRRSGRLGRVTTDRPPPEIAVQTSGEKGSFVASVLGTPQCTTKQCRLRQKHQLALVRPPPLLPLAPSRPQPWDWGGSIPPSPLLPRPLPPLIGRPRPPPCATLPLPPPPRRRRRCRPLPAGAPRPTLPCAARPTAAQRPAAPPPAAHSPCPP
jgi:hypothetical protein